MCIVIGKVQAKVLLSGHAGLCYIGGSKMCLRWVEGAARGTTPIMVDCLYNASLQLC